MKSEKLPSYLSMLKEIRENLLGNVEKTSKSAGSKIWNRGPILPMKPRKPIRTNS